MLHFTLLGRQVLSTLHNTTASLLSPTVCLAYLQTLWSKNNLPGTTVQPVGAQSQGGRAVALKFQDQRTTSWCGRALVLLHWAPGSTAGRWFPGLLPTYKTFNFRSHIHTHTHTHSHTHTHTVYEKMCGFHSELRCANKSHRDCIRQAALGVHF